MKCMAMVGILLAFASRAHAAGVLVEATGPVQVTIAGKVQPPKVGLELPDGTKVKAGAHAKAHVMLMDGAIVVLAAGEELEVGSTTAVPGKRTMIEGIQVALNEASDSGKGPTVHGMIKMGAPVTGHAHVVLGSASFGIDGLFPVHTAIEMTDTLTFRWRETQKQTWTNPVLVVKDTNDKELMVKPIPDGSTSLTIAVKDLGLLSGGSYSWNLGMKEGSNVTTRGSHFPFSLLADQAREGMKRDLMLVEGLGLSMPEAKKLLMGQIYYKYGLFDKAVQTLLPLSHPGSGTAIKDLLYMGYLRMGLTKEMKKYE